MINSILFLLLLIAGIGFFIRNSKKIIAAVHLGTPLPKVDRKKERWFQMLRLAFGQQKMHRNLLVGVLHLVVYLGFIIINIELLEIIVDGLIGTHRVFKGLGRFYNFAIATFEVFALLVVFSVIVFWMRRNLLRIARFWSPEMKGWPKSDANWILIIELVLMGLFLTMNAADYTLQLKGHEAYPLAGSFPVSGLVVPIFQNFSLETLVLIERVSWWMHIGGILFFLNYLYYSKHLHILLAFPHTFYASLDPKGKMANNEIVTSEVKMMLGLPTEPVTAEEVSFGARDVHQLSALQLLGAFSCTECGRCTASCPANQTGKLLSPRKIMMDTRDRATHLIEKGDTVKENFLLDHYITREELWACTTCNACVEECPIGISPMSIILSMRQYITMEEASSPSELNSMMTNIENNGAPWPFNSEDRLKWID
ncbi:MAG: (Fe-S)-binding protein [Flavobacteriaceae bacterium]|jgi:heterodisulfide reductase subunit C|nr:(Fe-S)-binding protein [Flavobacteriaceae bacterium]